MTLFTIQKTLPLLRDGASIILTGSTTGSTGTPASSVYSASKAAIPSFARCWILELAPRRIRVNVLAPGATLTPGWHGLASSDGDVAAMLEHVATTTPLARLGKPDETAAAALFLAADDSSYVTGSELFVDGGSAQIGTITEGRTTRAWTTSSGRPGFLNRVATRLMPYLGPLTIYRSTASG